MNPIQIPAVARQSRFYCRAVKMGPPKGVSEEDCGAVEMLCGHAPDNPGIGPANYAYFQPSAAELEIPNAGGFIEFAQYGDTVQPFGAAVWRDQPVDSPESVRSDG